MRLIDADRFEVFGCEVPMDVDADSFMRGVEFVLDKIDVAPTIYASFQEHDIGNASAERKKCEWVPAKDGIDGHVKCNQCYKTYDYDSEAQYYNFCPNCGADMRGEQNG